MANTDFGILLKTLLDKSGINSELEQVQKIINKYSVAIMPELKSSSLRNQMKSISQELANDFNKILGTNLTGKDVLKAFENQAKAIETAKKEQESYNTRVKEGIALAKKQANDAFVSKQSSIYGEIIKNQEQIYTLKKKLLSADELETEEINKQIHSLEVKNKYNRDYKLANNGMIDSSWEKVVQESNKALENQYRLTEAKKVDGAIAKEIAIEEKERAKALEFTRKESEKLASAIQKYSYGNSSSANDMMKQLNRGVGNFSDLSNVDKEITTISSNVDKIIDGLKRSHEQSLKALNSAISAEEKATKQIQPSIDNGTYSTQIDKMVSQFQKYGLSVDEAEEKVKELRATLLSMETAPSNESLVADYQKWEQQIKDVNVQLDQAKLKSEQIAEVNKIQSLTNGGVKNDYVTQIAQLEGNFRRLGLSQDEVSQKTSRVSTAFGELKTRISQPFNESNYQEIINLNDVLQRELIESSNEYTRLQASFKGFATEQQRLSLANTIEAWNQKNTAATREVVDENQRYILSLRDLSTEMRKVDFDRINTGFKQNENAMRAMNRLGKSLKEQFKQAYESFTMWLSASTLVMKVVSETKQAMTELKEVNTLLTEISKANDKLTKEQLTQIADDGFDTASKYGKKVTDYLSGVQEASRAGYENAEAIAELSVAIQGAGDVTEDIANSYVIATDKAYKLGGSVEALTEVFDGTNKITNLNAVNMSELAEAMTIVGSTAASFGVEVDETTAAIATMSAVTQQSGSEVARAFRAILLNIRQVSDEEEGIDAEGLTKYEKACNALGVSLKETKNGVLETRDAMDVLKELSEEYVKLDENDLRRTELLNSVGGKLRATQLDALLRNFDTYETMLQQYADGTGSMAREAEKTANSWEGSLNRLENTWTDTVENVANSDAIITILNSFNGLLSVINEVTSALGSLGTIGLGAGLFASFKGAGRVKIAYPHLYTYACRNKTLYA